jgi:hypothetical protein
MRAIHPQSIRKQSAQSIINPINEQSEQSILNPSASKASDSKSISDDFYRNGLYSNLPVFFRS